MQTIVPILRYEDARSAIAWLCTAFGFTERFSVPPSGPVVRHAQLALGQNLVMVGSVRPDDGLHSPRSLGGSTQAIYVFVGDVDAHWARASAMGARIESPPRDTDFGAREYHAQDPEGHAWVFGSFQPAPATELLQPIRTEYHRYRRLTELALEQVGDDDLAHRRTADGNSLAILLRHLTGNLRSRFTEFLSSDGEKPWRRRDEEFEPPSASRAELLAEWAAAWDVVEQALREVEAAGPDALARTVTIREQPLTVMEALLRSVAHVAYHTGQVVLLAREQAGPRWQTLSIPRGGSAAYAAHPTKEKGPDEAG